MKKPIIAVDVDDVLSQTVDAWRKAVNHHYGAKLQPEHYAVPDEYHHYFERVWKRHGLGEAVTFDAVEALVREDPTWFAPEKQAADVLQRLGGTYDFVVITAREGAWKPVTEQWLQTHFPGRFSDLVFVEDFTALRGKTKGDFCVELGASYLIDDSVAHVQSAIANDVPAILFGNLPWQQDIPAQAVRCRNWAEVEEHLLAARS